MFDPSTQVSKGQLAAALALALFAFAGCAGRTPLVPSAQNASSGASRLLHTNGGYGFTTIDNPDDLTFNILTGINNQDKISGYFGNGSPGHPNQGYVAYEPYGLHNFKDVSYPSATGTQITALNNRKTVAGFFVPPGSKSWIFGCIDQLGIWSKYRDPALRKGTSNITEFLGINDANLTVGFYTDDQGINHGFELNPSLGKYHAIIPPGIISVWATGINGKGDIVGYGTVASAATVSYMLKGGTFTLFSYPGSLDTKALGINWQDQIVGSYVDLGGATHGFVLTNPLTSQQWQTIDYPDAGTTAVTGIEDHRNIVGYYLDASGNTNGFFGTYSAKK